MKVPNHNSYPPGIPFIIGNEAAERFSYYGMKAILVVFMTQYLRDATGGLSPMTEGEAKSWYHLFGAANYLFPILGALVADIFWGKYQTIIRLSLVYCLGHAILALFETRMGLALGLTCIAVGSGGIKPCVSAHVGDQFSAVKSHLIEKVFSLFYFSINLGAFLSTLLTPYLLNVYGSQVAFGLPGLLMLLATIVFWLGRNTFTAIPPSGWTEYRAMIFSQESKKQLIRLSGVYLFIAVFWSLFDQTGSSWVLQAQQMDRTVAIPGITPFTVLPSQLQALNPVMVMVLIPIFSFGVYPLLSRYFELTALRKIGIGMVIASLSFVICGVAELKIQSGGVPVTILWQVLAYLVLTSSEVMVSITALEFSYTQAPNVMKSFVMGLFFLSVSLGNLFASGINALIATYEDSLLLQGANYYFFFAGCMLISATVFGWFYRRYEEQRHFQEG